MTFKHLLWILSLLLLEAGCGKFMSNLRKDLNESDSSGYDFGAPADPTVGGSWSERGYLDSSKDPDAEEGGSGPRGRRPAALVRKKTLDEVEGSRNGSRDNYRRNFVEPIPEAMVSSGTHPNLEPEKKHLYKNGARATRDDFVDHSQEEGSLWASSGQTNYYFTKNKVRNPGDIISLNIETELYKDIGIEVRNTLSPGEKAKEIETTQSQFRTKFMAELENAKKDTLASSASAPEKPNVAKEAAGDSQVAANTEPAKAPSLPVVSPEELDRLVPRATMNDVDIYPSLEVKPGETMMGEIIERYPNGNIKVRAVKKIPYKKGNPRLVSVVGVVRSVDINDETDVINSGKLYEYRVEVSH